MNVKGMDISSWQGNIDFSKVRSSGIEFAIIRAGFGSDPNSHNDPMFKTNINNAKANGIPVGAYWYSYATNVAMAQQEARYFLSQVSGYQLEYPLYFDIEDPSLGGLSNTQRTDMCITFCRTLENAGYYAGIYSSLNYFQNYLDLNRLTPFDKWLAQWSSSPSWGPEFGGMWQFTSSGAVNGISGRVDLNIAYKDYPTMMKTMKLNGFGNVIPPIPPLPTLKYKVGDYVYFKSIFSSSTSLSPLVPTYGEGTITKIIQGTPNPYLINETMGWVNDQVITGVKNPSTSIVVGDIVRILSAVSYDGVALNQSVLSKTYPVIEVNGERVVLGAGLNTAFKANNLVKVSGSSGNNFIVGSRVKIKQGAPDYNGVALASFVYQQVYTIIELNNNRAVLSDINTAVNTFNLYLA